MRAHRLFLGRSPPSHALESLGGRPISPCVGAIDGLKEDEV